MNPKLHDHTNCYNWWKWWEEDAYFFSSQRSRSYFYIDGKHGRIICRQDIDWTLRYRILQFGKIDQHDERKMPIVLQGRFIKVQCRIVTYRISRNFSENLILALLARLFSSLKLCIANNTFLGCNFLGETYWKSLKLRFAKIGYSIFRLKR